MVYCREDLAEKLSEQRKEDKKSNNKKFKLIKLDFNALFKFMKEVQSSRNNFYIRLYNKIKQFRMYCINVWMQRHRQLAIVIEYIIWTKFFVNLCIFEIEQPINYTIIQTNTENQSIFFYLFRVDNYLTLLMIIEILLKIFIYGSKRYFARMINIFDTTIVLINILSLISRVFDLGDNGILPSVLSPFNYLRILSVLYVKWKFLQIICASILSGINQLQANVVLYCIMYLILTVVAYRFLSTFISDREDDNLLSSETNFDTFADSAITVFYILFKFEWPSMAFNYLVFNKKGENEKPMFETTGRKSFVEFIPFIVEIFLLISIFIHLFFRELFVPQIIYYLDISKVLQIKVSFF